MTSEPSNPKALSSEQKAAIRARLKDGYVDVTTWDDATAIEDDVRVLLAALDQCEIERDRETELRRAAERHNSTLRAALETKPYPQEYDDAVVRAEAAEQEREAFKQEANALRRNYLRETKDLAERADKAEQQLAEARRLIGTWRTDSAKLRGGVYMTEGQRSTAYATFCCLEQCADELAQALAVDEPKNQA